MCKKYLLGALFIAFCCSVHAGKYCTETVTSLVTHKNGSVYFKTNKTCTNGLCKVNWDNSDNLNRAYSSMLAARVGGNELTFYWPNISDCTEESETYSSPDSISL